MADSIEGGDKQDGYAVDALAITRRGIGGFVGSDTITAGLPMFRVVPPEYGALAQVTLLDYKAGTTGHKVTPLMPIGSDSVTVTQEAVWHAATIRVSGIPRDSTGGAPADGDWFLVRGANEKFYAYVVASWADPVITIKNIVGWGHADTTGIVEAIPVARRLWWLGNPDYDYTSKRLSMGASQQVTLPGKVATTPKTYQPIVMHSDNITAAAASFQILYDHLVPTS